jgi:hypothetical protein
VLLLGETFFCHLVRPQNLPLFIRDYLNDSLLINNFIDVLYVLRADTHCHLCTNF